MDLHVGFVGLGHMGAPMAQQIIESGIPTTLYARRPDALKPFAETEAEVAPTLTALGASGSVICICVDHDDQVRDVLTRQGGILEGVRPGAAIVVHSTVRVETIREMAELAARHGADLIDAPVSGGKFAPRRRTLAVHVGGDPAVVARCRPVFETYGPNSVFHVGPLGSGEVATFLNATLCAANLASATAALDVAEQLGLDRGLFLQLALASSGGSRVLQLFADLGASIEGLVAAGARVLHKDVDRAREAVEVIGSAPPALFDQAERFLADLAAAEGGSWSPTS